MRNVIIVALAFTVFALAEAMYYFISYLGQRGREDLRRRVEAVTHAGSKVSLLRESKMSHNSGIAQVLDSFGFARSLESVLLQTDLNLTVAMLLTIGASIGLGFSLLFVVLLQKSALFILLCVPVGFIFPLLFIYSNRERRSRKLSEQLPDALEMMTRSLRAGHSIGSGFKLVAQEMAAPVSVEFGRCFEEQNAGVTLRDSIQNMTERVAENLDLKIFAVSIVIQSETGGNLIEILEKIATTIRQRFNFYGKLRALTGEAKVSGVVLGGLPVACAFMLLILRPGYMAPLFSDKIGLMIVFGGLVSWTIGGVWMRKLSQVDF